MFHWKRRRQSFTQLMKQSFPPELYVPEPLTQFFDWQEASGLVGESDGGIYGKLDPAQEGWCMYTEPVHPGYAEAWIGDSYIADRGRLAPFVKTGGDGSMAGLWLDDQGKQHFVHLPSGSGSTMLSILCSDAIDFLRLLAIGYEKLCWPDNLDLTPEEEHSNTWKNDLDAPPYIPRVWMRRWVEGTFGVAVPSIGREVVKRTSEMFDDQSDDPFWNWIMPIQHKDP